MRYGKTIFHGSSKVTIIDATDEAAKAHGTRYGAEVIYLDKKDMNALRDGKCVAIDDGEYVTFLVLKAPTHAEGVEEIGDQESHEKEEQADGR